MVAPAPGARGRFNADQPTDPASTATGPCPWASPGRPRLWSAPPPRSRRPASAQAKV